MNAHPRPAARPLARPLALLIFSAGALALAGCGAWADDVFCDAPGCGFSNEEWARISSLAKLGEPPADLSNASVHSGPAATLGQAFYFDARFSGLATQVDALGRPAAVPRAAKGAPVNLSCASCHDLGRAGVDVTSTPGNVSSGAGWTDVNALSTVNSAYQHLFFWNGRVDSLWALSAGVAESATTMNGNRLHTARLIADLYRADFESLFGPLPIPDGDTACSVQAQVATTGPLAGQCPLVNGLCPPPCQPGSNQPTGDPGCWPRFPLQGKPGSKQFCQAGDPTEPFGDAFDCMELNDQLLVTRVLVNWAKALEAFQYQLRDRAGVGSALDQWVAMGPKVDVVSESARRGAQLFVTKGGCVDCHNTPLLTDGLFHDIGVAQVGPDVPTLADCFADNPTCDCVSVNGTKCLPWGEYDGLQKLAMNKFLRSSMWSDDLADMSRAADVAETPTAAMRGAWRTPGLRNVALTAPYMHDGRYATLAEVVDHYNRGGDVDAVGTRDVEIKPLLLTDDEQADLVAFLGALTEPPLAVDLVKAPTLPTNPVCP
jgi:cytochrome c peroxidase